MKRSVDQVSASDIDLTASVLIASRALVGVAARSLAALEADITLGQYRALVLLHQHGELNAGRLAGALAIKPSTTTGLCDRLESKGLITRSTPKESRREVKLRLSASGRALVRAVTSRRRREIARILEKLEDAAQRRVADALEAFAAAAGEAPDEAWKLGWT